MRNFYHLSYDDDFKELKFQVDEGCRKIRNYFQSFPINFPTLWLQKKEKKSLKCFE